MSTARPAPRGELACAARRRPRRRRGRSRARGRRSCARARRPCALEARSTPVPSSSRHAVLDVQVAVDRADLRPEHALERHRRGSTTVTSRPRWRAEAATSAPIQPAPMTTTGRRGRARRAARRCRRRCAGSGRRRGRRPGSAAARLRPVASSSRVVAQPLAVGELDLAAAGVDRGHRGAGSSSIVVLGVEPLRVHVDVLALGLAAQVVLGQRRTLVRALALGADEHDAPVEALLAQRLGGLGAGQARRRRSRTSVSAMVASRSGRRNSCAGARVVADRAPCTPT